MLRKKLKIPSTTIKSSLRMVSSTKKALVRVAHSSFARVKHLVSVNIKKMCDMQTINNILLKSLHEQLKTRVLPCNSNVKKPSSSR